MEIISVVLAFLTHAIRLTIRLIIRLILFLCLYYIQLNPWPAFINERLEMYNKLKAEHDALLAERAANDSKPIKVTLPDGKQVDAESWKTTPYQIACGIRYVSIL